MQKDNRRILKQSCLNLIENCKFELLVVPISEYRILLNCRLRLYVPYLFIRIVLLLLLLFALEQRIVSTEVVGG